MIDIHPAIADTAVYSATPASPLAARYPRSNTEAAKSAVYDPRYQTFLVASSSKG